MPCGGVFPLNIVPADGGISPGNLAKSIPEENRLCFWCGRPGAGHFYEEFDDFCHAVCFLRDLHYHPEGEAMICLLHEHHMILDTTADEYPILGRSKSA